MSQRSQSGHPICDDFGPDLARSGTPTFWELSSTCSALLLNKFIHAMQAMTNQPDDQKSIGSPSPHLQMSLFRPIIIQRFRMIQTRTQRSIMWPSPRFSIEPGSPVLLLLLSLRGISNRFQLLFPSRFWRVTHPSATGNTTSRPTCMC
jgi:hypothetical protein